MHIDELRDTLADIASARPAPRGEASVVIARGQRRLLRRRLSAAALVLAIAGAGAGFALHRHDASRGIEVGPAPSPSTPVPAPASRTRSADGTGALFTSSTEGWICSDPLLHTADGGHTWQSASYGNIASGTRTCAAVPTDAWIAVQAPDGRVTLLPAQGGPNLAVSKGLATLPAATVVEQLTFVDQNVGWLLAVGDHGAADRGLLYRTTTGAGPMQFTLVSNDAPARGVNFVNATDGWGITGSGVFRTTDGGATWRSVSVPTPIRNVAARAVSLEHLAVHRSVIVVQGRNPAGPFDAAFFLVSTDGGATWAERNGPGTQLAATEPAMLDVPTPQQWRLGAGREMWTTDDGGRSWTLSALPLNTATISFPTGDDGWATDPYGHVQQTTNAGRTWQPVGTTPEPGWSSVIAAVPTGCPARPVIAPPTEDNGPDEARRAAEEFVLRARGWTGEYVQAVYPVLQPGGQFGAVFSTNVAKFCGRNVAALSYGVELFNSSITQDSSRITSLVVAHFADGWKVWGFYR